MRAWRWERRQMRLALAVAVVAATAITVAVRALGSREAPARPATADVDEKALPAEEVGPEEASTGQARAEFAALRRAFEKAKRTGAEPELTDAQYRTFCFYTYGEFSPEPGNPECRVVFWDVFSQDGGYQTRCTYYTLLDDYTVPLHGPVEEGPVGARPDYKKCVTGELLDS